MPEEKKSLTNEQLIARGLTVCVVSSVALMVSQFPTPDYLNPFGCLFGVIAMCSGIFALMGALFSIK